MYKLIKCPKCDHLFAQLLPTVTAAEAAQLKADDNDRGVFFNCPQCQEEIRLHQWSLPDLPDAP